jgi:hypothetical protein
MKLNMQEPLVKQRMKNALFSEFQTDFLLSQSDFLSEALALDEDDSAGFHTLVRTGISMLFTRAYSPPQWSPGNHTEPAEA